VQVAPGVDLALITALCICLDEKNNEGKYSKKDAVALGMAVVKIPEQRRERKLSQGRAVQEVCWTPLDRRIEGEER
jgi:hypothetical protein